MRVWDAIERIRFYTGTLDDVTGRAINNLFTDKIILQLLSFQLNEYATITKAIEDIFSFSLTTQVPWIEAPKLALRSEAYKSILVLVNGRYFLGDMQGLQTTYNAFPYRPVQGITNWLLPWGEGSTQKLYFMPLSSNTYKQTFLTSNCNKSDTTITVNSTSQFITNDGRITIGSEKICFKSKDATNFYGCERGVELTEPQDHVVNDDVLENNVILFYRRLHIDLPITSDNFVPKDTLDIELEVCQEHIEGILKATAYNLLLKLSPSRAQAYKVDAVALYDQYKQEIRRGRSAIRQGTGIRNPNMNEMGIPMYTNLL